ncbi:hypothetical protein P4B35_21090 [Pontiellaceae bacterium B12227]|nr:hypothetical protein [Pontiellaceae bacterium B12227]
MIALLLCGMVLAEPVNNPSRDWKALRAKNLEMGLSDERVEEAIGVCRSSGLTVVEAEDLFSPVYAAKAEHLPTDCIFLKIEEGLAKGAPWEMVHLAADKRLNCLRRADELITAVRQNRGGQHAHLVSHTCMALESGLSEESLSALFSKPGGFRYGRLIHVVEAGESLKLAGLSSEQTLQIMNECHDRNLTGAEIFRVVDVLKAGLRTGTDFNMLHSTLWAQTDSL